MKIKINVVIIAALIAAAGAVISAVIVDRYRVKIVILEDKLSKKQQEVNALEEQLHVKQQDIETQESKFNKLIEIKDKEISNHVLKEVIFGRQVFHLDVELDFIRNNQGNLEKVTLLNSLPDRITSLLDLSKDLNTKLTTEGQYDKWIAQCGLTGKGQGDSPNQHLGFNRGDIKNWMENFSFDADLMAHILALGIVLQSANQKGLEIRDPKGTHDKGFLTSLSTPIFDALAMGRSNKTPVTKLLPFHFETAQGWVTQAEMTGEIPVELGDFLKKDDGPKELSLLEAVELAYECGLISNGQYEFLDKSDSFRATSHDVRYFIGEHRDIRELKTQMLARGLVLHAANARQVKIEDSGKLSYFASRLLSRLTHEN